MYDILKNKLKEFGVFVEIFRGIEGLVHITELAAERIENPGQIAADGDEMIVKVLGTTKDGKLELSRKAALTADLSELDE